MNDLEALHALKLAERDVAGIGQILADNDGLTRMDEIELRESRSIAAEAVSILEKRLGGRLTSWLNRQYEGWIAALPPEEKRGLDRRLAPHNVVYNHDDC